MSAHIQGLFDAARARGGPIGLLMVEAYCRNAACPAREVTIKLKEFGEPTSSRLICPVCKRALACHSVLTFSEYYDRADAYQQFKLFVETLEEGGRA